MFNYTNEIVINSANALNKVESGVLSLYRNGNFKVANMSYVKHSDGSVVSSKIAKTTGAAGKVGSLVVTNAKGTSGDLVRIYFKIACSAKYAEFAMANWGAFEKPVMAEFVSDGTVAPLVAALQQVLDPEVATVVASVSDGVGTPLVYGEDGTLTSTTAAVLLSEEVYAIVPESVKAVKVTSECNECNGYSEETEEEISNIATPTAPVEGKGTYEYILQNLRYPTRENLRYAAPNADEMPIKGAIYDEYNFDYTVKRSNPSGGLSAVGQELTSTVHITFFVKNDVTITGLAAIAEEHTDSAE